MNGNLLLRRMPVHERRSLLAMGQIQALEPDSVLGVQDAPMRGLAFPLRGCLALHFQLDEFPPLQLAVVGRESCVGALLLLGSTRNPYTTRVQQAGEAIGLSAKSLSRLLPENPSLRRLLGAEVQRQHLQLAVEAACARFHSVGPRLARWMLSYLDRSGGLRIEATHLEMATCLGVRREAVSSAAFELQLGGSIFYRRGRVEVLDRGVLLAAACSCYGRMRRRRQAR